MVLGSLKRKALIAVCAASAVAAIAYGVLRSVAAPDVIPPAAYTLLNGTPTHTAELTGRVVLVNFWATSCAICLEEMPELVATHARFKTRGFETLAIAMAYDAPFNVVRYSEARALPFQVAIDHDGSLAERFGKVVATPTSLLINKRGEIVERHLGRLDFAALDTSIERLLAAP
jgi:thiol-disulfide isomerase/thioredoxin